MKDLLKIENWKLKISFFLFPLILSTFLLPYTLYLIPYTASAAARLNIPPNYLRTSTGLIGHWTMDGTDMNWSANKALDKSGNGNDGVLVSMSTTTSPKIGKLGQSLTFDGSTDYVTMGDVADPAAGDYSKFAWVKTSATFTGMVASKRDGDTATNAGTHLFLNSTTVSATLGDGSASRIRVDSTAPVINDGVWHHVGATYDRDGNLQIYVDGVPATGGSGPKGQTPYKSGGFRCAESRRP